MFIGCQQQSQSEGLVFRSGKCDKELAVFRSYAPVKVDILPLTEVININSGEDQKLKIYVCLIDESNNQTKSPGVFRFELYEYVQRSAETKGRRIMIWPDIDLVETRYNQQYWRDFLRAYEFTLDFDQQHNSQTVLQVTYMCPGWKRLSDDFSLNIEK
jgi:hypothetical protein